MALEYRKGIYGGEFGDTELERRGTYEIGPDGIPRFVSAHDITGSLSQAQGPMLGGQVDEYGNQTVAGTPMISGGRDGAYETLIQAAMLSPQALQQAINGNPGYASLGITANDFPAISQEAQRRNTKQLEMNNEGTWGGIWDTLSNVAGNPLTYAALGTAGVGAWNSALAGGGLGGGLANAAGAMGGAAGPSFGGLSALEAAGGLAGAGSGLGALPSLTDAAGAMGGAAGESFGGLTAAEAAGGAAGASGTGQSLIQQLQKMVQGGGSNAASAGSLLSKVLGGTATMSDYAEIAAKLGAAGLGAYASNQQAGAMNDLAQQYMGFGAPSRARFEASMTPGFQASSIPGYQVALDDAMNSQLRGLSAVGGNPFGNPGGLIEAQKKVIAGTQLPAIQEYQRLNLGAGGQANLNAAVPGLQTGAIGADSNTFNALGYGLGALTQPKQQSLSDLLKQFSGGGALSLT